MYSTLNIGKLPRPKGSHEQHQAVWIVFEESFQATFQLLQKPLPIRNWTASEGTVEAYHQIRQAQEKLTQWQSWDIDCQTWDTVPATHLRFQHVYGAVRVSNTAQSWPLFHQENSLQIIAGSTWNQPHPDQVNGWRRSCERAVEEGELFGVSQLAGGLVG